MKRAILFIKSILLEFVILPGLTSEECGATAILACMRMSKKDLLQLSEYATALADENLYWEVIYGGNR